MFVRCFLFTPRACLPLALAALFPTLAGAHGAFDHNARVWIFDDHLEVTVTTGPEVAKMFLNNGPEAVLRSGHMEVAFPLPVESAARIFEIKSGDTLLEPTKTTVRSDGLEYVFGFFYSRPESGALHCSALYLNETPTLPKGSLVVVDENGSALAGKILSSANHLIEFALPAKPAAPTPVDQELQVTPRAVPIEAMAPAATPTAPPTAKPAIGAAPLTLLLPLLIAVACATACVRYLKKSAPRKHL